MDVCGEYFNCIALDRFLMYLSWSRAKEVCYHCCYLDLHYLTESQVIHAEMPVHDPGKPEPRGLQLWVDLPKEVHIIHPSVEACH